MVTIQKVSIKNERNQCHGNQSTDRQTAFQGLRRQAERREKKQLFEIASLLFK